MPDNDGALDFDGAPEFLEWLYALDLRPWVLTHERPLPIVHLQTSDRPGAARSVLEALRGNWTKHRLRGAGQCVIVAPSHVAEGDGVERLLAAAAAQFFQRKGFYGGPKARRFALASWLAALQRETPGSLSEDKVFNRLKKYLAEHEFRYEDSGMQLGSISNLPWWIEVLGRIGPRLVLRVADKVFGPQRWIERRGRGLAPSEDPDEIPLQGNLFTLAERLAGIRGAAPTARQTEALLTDAFLEDLRRRYSRRRVFGAGRRRRTYPVLLLGCDTDPAAADLIRAIKNVRNEGARRGRNNRRTRRAEYKWDPLLVVAAGPAAAAAIDADLEMSAPARPGSPEDAHDDWDNARRNAAKRRQVWLLPFTIPTGESHPTVRDRVRRTRPPRRVPWMSFLGLVALVAAMIAVPVISDELCRPWWSPAIRPWPPWVLDSMVREDGGDTGQQCVGLSEGLPPEVPGALDEPINTIIETNKEVMKQPGYITVVHLSMLSPGNVQGDRAAREELRGMAVAQRESLKDKAPVRVLFANAGADMKYADLAARKIIAAKDRYNIVGVTGLGLSTRQTVKAVERLGQAGIPSIGSATTADELLTASPYYYGVAASNHRQADFATRYATRDLHARSARIYYNADPDDIYSGELATSIRDQMRNAAMAISEYEGYRNANSAPGMDTALLGRHACQAAKTPDQVVVYAGRAEQFDAFLSGMKLACQGRYPRILATDDISRFVLTGANRSYPGLKLEYIALASSALWGKNCQATQRQSSFYIGYNDLFGSACDENRDGRALLSYDALAVVRQAAVNVRAQNPLTLKAQGIVAGLAKIGGAGSVSGVSGDLDYSDPGAPQTPKNKAILLLRSTEGQPCLVKVEGRFSSQPRIAKDC